ncbi:PepSY domain-containing protein [Limnothrix sp. FACHB-881]|uniref:PepSY-associated TM helix domain-containing protein n=1 Tax=Limnothrix sp. FACHB-881 TaxID=2692819 RepID=UPI0016867133|nr:PepSY-associated TM helix domain-containing protein [Limnothrix sp. FACHB-881]MBD2635798.1 PepSY domain-containing protein [Limnothrix sp. FACHB-881]
MESPQKPLPKSLTRLLSAKLRTISFFIHRWLGLAIGILLCIAGLTGSVLVFWHEIDHWVLAQRLGTVVPAGTIVPVAAIIESIKAAYGKKQWNLSTVAPPQSAQEPYQAWLETPAHHHWQVFVHPYTGQIMGDREWESSWVGLIYDLHYKLLAGETGTLIMGIVALLTLILSLTGIVLWPGWRNFMAGFKIKWKNAHIKRTNFDIHKVSGIITAIFLGLIGFTGFAWNVPQAKVNEAIYTVTFTPKPAAPVSKPIPGQQPLSIAELIQRAEAVIPDATMTYIVLPKKPESPLIVSKRQTQERSQWGNTRVAIDQFTGELIQLTDGLKPTRAEAIMSQFDAVHFGTFGGLATRILYVFVGLAPLALLITGFVMWKHRRRVPKPGHS